MDYTISLFTWSILGYLMESLVVRLYSEIDHTYLSSEAQCVSHHYPRWTATTMVRILMWALTMRNLHHILRCTCMYMKHTIKERNNVINLDHCFNTSISVPRKKSHLNILQKSVSFLGTFFIWFLSIKVSFLYNPHRYQYFDSFIIILQGPG